MKKLCVTMITGAVLLFFVVAGAGAKKDCPDGKYWRSAIGRCDSCFPDCSPGSTRICPKDCQKKCDEGQYFEKAIKLCKHCSDVDFCHQKEGNKCPKECNGWQNAKLLAPDNKEIKETDDKKGARNSNLSTELGAGLGVPAGLGVVVLIVLLLVWKYGPYKKKKENNYKRDGTKKELQHLESGDDDNMGNKRNDDNQGNGQDNHLQNVEGNHCNLHEIDVVIHDDREDNPDRNLGDHGGNQEGRQEFSGGNQDSQQEIPEGNRDGRLETPGGNQACQADADKQASPNFNRRNHPATQNVSFGSNPPLVDFHPQVGQSVVSERSVCAKPFPVQESNGCNTGEHCVMQSGMFTGECQ